MATIQYDWPYHRMQSPMGYDACCPCFHCRGSIPLEVEVTLAGFVDFGVPTCTDCASLNETYTLDLEWTRESGFVFTDTPNSDDYLANNFKQCTWRYRFPEPRPCAGVLSGDGWFDLYLAFTKIDNEIANDWTLLLTLQWDSLGSGDAILLGHQDLDIGVDRPLCTTMDGKALDFYAYAGIGSSLCDATGATAAINLP